MKTRYIIQESARGIGRNRAAFFLAMSVQAVCLTLLAIFVVITLNLGEFVRSASRKIEVYAFLADDAEVQPLLERVRLIDGIASARFVSKEEALAELRADLGEDAAVVEALGENPLPASVRLTLGTGFGAFDRLEEIEHKVALLPGVNEVWSGRESLARLTRILRAAIGLGFGVLVIVAVSITFVAFQTAETAILTRRREIEIMELVGATRASVHAPFMIEGVLQGLLGGAFAFVFTLVLKLVADAFLPAPVFPLGAMLALTLLFGAFLGLLGSTLALNRIR